jgi:predicted dehydrogenase
MNRRKFIENGIKSAAVLSIVPSSVLGNNHGHVSPSDKMNIAAIGIGGMGNANLKNIETKENIVALCDVDWKYTKRVFERLPNAKRYWDYRKMFDEMGKSIDGVIVATPDHTHAIIAADAITLGKNVYVQKPLTHSVYEARLLTKLAERYQVVSQMGNQGASGEGVNLICEWIWNGEIGEVRKVEAFTNRPVWPQGITPPRPEKIPSTLNWDLFTGPAEYRPYNSLYTPGDWRGWWAYGTGALGDMACHILHPVFTALKLGYPTKVQGNSTLLFSESAPLAEQIKLTFPARDNLAKVAMPEVEVIWSDGNLHPFFPEGYPKGKEMQSVIFHGTKDTLICGEYGDNPWLLSRRIPDAPKVCRRVPGGSNIHKGMHEQDWIRACKESPSSRIKPKSDFAVAGPFTEMVVMGVLAVRLQGLNKELLWDGNNMQFTNIEDNETIEMCLEDGVIFHDGHPSSDKKWSDPIPAKKFAAELIKHTYRKGWNLVDMPK